MHLMALLCNIASSMFCHYNMLPDAVVANARAGRVGGDGAAVVGAGAVVMYQKKIR